jgi:hypothetical protein
MSENRNDLENMQWDAFEQALLSIESQVANLRAMLAALRDNKGDGRHIVSQWDDSNNLHKPGQS